jgi:hypothetical protein
MSSAQEWDVFSRRKAFLSGTLAFALGEEEPIRCTAVNQFVEALLFIDLVSVLDSALQERLSQLGQNVGRTLHERIESLRSGGHLLAPLALHAIRERRNELAHEAKRLRPNELQSAVTVVECELQAWRFVAGVPNYIPFFDRSQWTQRTSGGTLRYERDFAIGVQVAETGKPVFSYEYEQHADNPELPGSTITVERKGVGAV